MSDPSVLDVAKYILVRSGHTMSTMKLQKLTYYCQAWTAAWTGRPLFPQTFQAWANGPVCYEMFQQHRGRYSISAESMTAGDASKVTPDLRPFIDAVINAYLPLSGTELSLLTHSEAPWRDARGSLPPGASSNAPIALDSMRKFYKRLVKDPDARSVTDLERPAWA